MRIPIVARIVGINYRLNYQPDGPYKHNIQLKVYVHKEIFWLLLASVRDLTVSDPMQLQGDILHLMKLSME